MKNHIRLKIKTAIKYQLEEYSIISKTTLKNNIKIKTKEWDLFFTN